jgi:selenocysteine lyase/cysteine desulfurase
VWDGDFYATGLIERLGLADRGGVVRIGLTHYNTAAEVDRLVEALGRVAAGARPPSTVGAAG